MFTFKPKTKAKSKATSKKHLSAKDRFIKFLRRLGIRAAIIIFVLWLVAWGVLGGFFMHSLDAGKQGIYRLAAHAGFEVQDILVEGRVRTDADLLLALLNIERGDPIFIFKPKDVKETIEKITWVKTVNVKRRLPHTIYIGITERTPMALWQYKKQVKLIDTEGFVLTDVPSPEFKDLVMVVGENAPHQAPKLLSILSASPQIYKEIDSLTYIGGRRWDMTMKNGILVKLPETDAALALERLVLAQEESNILTKDVHVIDLRQNDRIIIRTKPGQTQDYQARYNLDKNKGKDI